MEHPIPVQIPAAAGRAPFVPLAAAPAAASRVQRVLRLDEYSQAQSGVWYYQVDIEIRSARHHDVEASGSFVRLDPCDEDDVKCYSVRRRYNEFAQLYEKIKEQIMTTSTDPVHAVGDSGLPPFPQKQLISSSMLGMLWRVSAPTYVLEERRAKFEALLRWIEYQPTLRDSAAFLDFLGQPPQVSEGYVSLRQYSSQNWLSSLEKLTKQKEQRRRRLSSDCSSCGAMLAEQPPRRTKKRRQFDENVALSSQNGSSRMPIKRQRRLAEPTTHKARSPAISSTPCHKKRARALSSLTSDDKAALCDTTDRQLTLLSGDADNVAQVESSHKPKKKKIQ